MSLVATLAGGIGASIGKAVIKSYVKDESLLAEVAPDLVDIFKEGGSQWFAGRNSAAAQLQKLGERVMSRLEPLFEREGKHFADGERTAVALEVARTLSRAQISADLLMDCHLNPERLKRQLELVAPEATRGFSEAGTALYHRTLSEASQGIVAIGTELAGFTQSAISSTLEGQERILTMLARLQEQPDAESARFGETYRRAIIRSLDRMEMFGIPWMDRETARQTLTLAYVTLQVERRPVDPRAGEKEAEVELGARGDLGERGELRLERSAKAPLSGPIDQMIGLSRRLVVHGEAGSGKSTLLQWAAVRAARRDLPGHLAFWNDCVPFFIRLRERVGREFPRPEEFPGLLARNISAEMPQGWVQRQLREGRALVLVDGVDELPQKQRTEMLEQLDQLIQDFPLARYIITSRPAALKSAQWPEWREWVTGQEFTEIALQPMSQGQIEDFVKQWHQAFGETIEDEDERETLAELPDNLIRLLKQRPALRKLATSPLLCAMICALHRDRRQQLPSERNRLYRECCEMLLERRETGRKIDLTSDYPRLNESQKFAVVQSLAYWMLENGYSDVEVGEADRHLGDRLPSMALSLEVTGSGVRRYLVERAALLREPVTGRIDFTHRTFQEFLAARHALKENNIGVLLKNARDDQWREVIILAAGEARPAECEKLMNGLLARAERLKGRNRKQVLLLAVACLETCVELRPDVRQLVLNRASECFPPEDEADTLLCSAAGEPAVPLLRSRSEQESDEAARCVRALELIGTDAAMNAIAEYAEICDSEELGRAIWGARECFDRNAYVDAVLSRCSTLAISGISSFAGLDRATRLTQLSINGGLNDALFRQLPSLPRLQRLRITNAEIGDLTPLARVPHLRTLHIERDYNIRVIDPIMNLSELNDLRLTETQIGDLSALSRLKNLITLYLTDSSISDLTPISGLTRLRNLGISGSSVSSFEIMRELTNLEILFASYTPVRDLEPLSKLVRLKTLFLGGNAVNDLTPLANLPGLENVYLAGAEVKDFTPLLNLPRLRTLHISRYQLPFLRPLEGKAGLTINAV